MEELDDLLEAYLKGKIDRTQFERLVELLGREEPQPERVLRAYWDSQPAPATAEVSAEPAKLKRIHWRWYAAAAVIAIFIGGGGYWLINHRPTQPPIAKVHKDVNPGRQGAVLLLADGSTKVLDSLHDGVIASQGGHQVTLDNGRISYGPQETKPGEVLYNTIYTPVGRQFVLRLSDGSSVWLNAGSSIRYPVSFAGAERRVQLTGEAYFEVAQNAKQPFTVNIAGKESIAVLGTSFDIDAYSNEPVLRTTLVTGAVKITAGSQSLVMQPRQQAQLDKDRLSIASNPDIDAVLAWKNGQFTYNGVDIGTIMRQVERWYGVQVIYKDTLSEQFVADIPRNVPLSKLLTLLEGTGQVNFTLDNNVLTVSK